MQNQQMQLDFCNIVAPRVQSTVIHTISLPELRKLDQQTLLSFFNQLYGFYPKQDDRGFLIRHIHKTFNLPEEDPLARPFVSTLPITPRELCLPCPSLHPSKFFSSLIPYRSASGSYLWLRLEAFIFDREQIPLMPEFQRFDSCGYCKGSSGGCPTFAPHFTQIKPSIKKFLVLSLSMDTKWVFKNVWKDRKQHYRNATLMFLMFPDRLTDNYLRRIIAKTKKTLGYNLFVGNCTGCRPKNCTVRNAPNGICSNPSARTFSMEATGVDCDALHYDLYEHWLPWFFSREPYVPGYITRYTGFFTEEHFELITCDLKKAIQSDQSYDHEIPTHKYIDTDCFLSPRPTPRWNHEGELQYTYDTTPYTEPTVQ